MSNLSILVYSLFIILIIMLDYIHSYKKNLSRNSMLYFIITSSVALIIIINIVFMIFHINNLFTTVLLILGYLLIIIPALGLALYIRINFFYGYVSHVRKSIIHVAIYWFIYLNFIIYFFLTYKIDFNNIHLTLIIYNKLIIFTIIPIVYILIYSLYKKIKSKKTIDTRVLSALLIICLGLIIDLLLNTVITIIPAYTIAIILLYAYKTNVVLCTDPLTNLYNRRIILEKFSDGFHNSSSYIAAYFIDINDFKLANDIYGHNFGDKVLKDLALIIKSSIRTSDYAIRLGGDEFLIIAFLRQNKGIDRIPEKIYSLIEQYNNENNINDYKLAISIGYDIYDNNAELFDEFIEKIDKKMYTQKSDKKRTKK